MIVNSHELDSSDVEFEVVLLHKIWIGIIGYVMQSQEDICFIIDQFLVLSYFKVGNLPTIILT